MSRDQIEYLESLARLDLRKRERALSRLHQRSARGQIEQSNYERLVNATTDRIAFISSTLQALREQRSRVTALLNRHLSREKRNA